MVKKVIGCLAVALILTLGSFSARAQDEVQTFKNFQFSFPRVNQAVGRFNDSVRKMFTSKGLAYPPKNIYFRAFKSTNEMELWARNDDSSKFQLVKVYRVCASSGVLGPKRVEGDRQVPEGFYFIDEFKPNSDYYLSMLLNYPNYSDMLCGIKGRLGGDVYIHGGCLTIGCLPMTDDVIQEIYTLCLNAKINGQTYIPVHIYPVRFDRKGLNYLGRSFPDDVVRQQFWVNLKAGYDYFERHRKLLPVMYTPDGKYAF